MLTAGTAAMNNSSVDNLPLERAKTQKAIARWSAKHVLARNSRAVYTIQQRITSHCSRHASRRSICRLSVSLYTSLSPAVNNYRSRTLNGLGCQQYNTVYCTADNMHDCLQTTNLNAAHFSFARLTDRLYSANR